MRLSIGALIIGSLYWDRKRQVWRDSRLRMDEVYEVPARIRYGRRSSKRGNTWEFDLTLNYENDPDVTGYRTVVGATMIIAFQEQLGLKLESTRGPVEVLVIDHAEQPSEN